MDVYGLTGGIGSGKSTVADLLEDYGVPVVSADELSRIVVSRGSDGLADVVAAFGDEVVSEDGELDRKKMAAIVFRDPSRRRELEAILHPRIRERFEQVLDALEKAGHSVAVYEVPLLFEKNLQTDMKAVVLVSADDAVRIGRVQERDDVTETEVRARMAAQMDEALKRKRADYIVENNGSMDALRREVEFLLDRFLRVGSRTSTSLLAQPGPTTPAATPTPTPNELGDPIPAPPVPVPDTARQPSRIRTEIPSEAPAVEVRTGETLPPGVIQSPMPPAPTPRHGVPIPSPGGGADATPTDGIALATGAAQPLPGSPGPPPATQSPAGPGVSAVRPTPPLPSPPTHPTPDVGMRPIKKSEK